MSKTEYLFNNVGEYGGYLKWDNYGDTPCINKFIALNEEPFHFLKERYFLDNKKKVVGITEYTQSKKSMYGKPLKSIFCEPTSYKEILDSGVEPTEVQYHMIKNMKSTYSNFTLKARETKEEVVNKLQSGIENANYIRESLGIIIGDKINEKATTIKNKTSNTMDSAKQHLVNRKNSITDTITNNRENITSKITENKEKAFNKISNIWSDLKQTTNNIFQNFTNRKENLKNLRQSKNNNTKPPSPIIIIINTQENLTENITQQNREGLGIAQPNIYVSNDINNILDYVSRVQSGGDEVYNEMLDEMFLNTKQSAKTVK